MKQIRVAVLDMNNGEPNHGFASILNILSHFQEFYVESFDIRQNQEVPGMDFDIYVSSGGPGTPIPEDGHRNEGYFSLMDAIWDWNLSMDAPKYCFFICHSFQMIAHHMQIGEVIHRHSEAFGVFPIHLTAAGKRDPLFNGLSDPLYAADFRKWQLVQPDKARLRELGASILALEKIRPHVDRERAVMAVRFSPYWAGVQFHPEAEPGGMFRHFSEEKRKQQVIGKRGARKYAQMIGFTKDPEKLSMTYRHVLPGFFRLTRDKLKSGAAVS